MESYEAKRMKKYKSYFQEMAFSRTKIEDEIRSSNRTRAEHLILIYFLSKDQALHHWQTEVEADILDISEMKWKVNNKYLSAKEYFNNLWNMPFENNDNYELIDKHIEGLLYDGYPIPKNWKNHKKDLVNKMINLYLTLSELLYKGDVSKLKIRELISEFAESQK